METTACGMDVIEARGLPEAPLDAAAQFSNKVVPIVRAGIKGGCIVLFDPADHTHDAWRYAAIAELAREAAPGRVNAIVGSSVDTIRETLSFLESAPGVTGQVFKLA